jgi:vacuolar-type H+-ATPase subunit E/Vma4
MPDAVRMVVTDAEIDAAIERGRRYAKYDRRVLKATYSKTTDRLRLVLDDGSTVTIPRALIQGLSDASERELKRIQILSDGTGLLWPLLDVAHYVPGLLGGVYGTEKWMAALFKQKKRLRLVGKASRRRRESRS